jgi:hypothetical protein
MSSLKVGFAKVEVNPQFGTPIAGYYQKRLMDGVLDPLYVIAVAFQNEENRAVLLSIDNVGITKPEMDVLRSAVAERIGTAVDAVYAECTHSHTAPEVRLGSVLSGTYTPEEVKKTDNYFDWLVAKAGDAAMLAFQDLSPAKMSYTRGIADKVSFIRRFRMPDGSVLTNPREQYPQTVGPAGEADETVQLLIIKRENAPEIGVVNFQVHPDVIGGCAVSSDYPHFVRQTYEKLIDNSRCIYLNGTCGDTNHADWSIWNTDKCFRGYDRARYMGRKIAMAAVANYELAEPISGDKIAFGHKAITVKMNKGTEAELPLAKELSDYYDIHGLEYSTAYVQKTMGIKDMVPAKTLLRRYLRIHSLKDAPDQRELYVSALIVGDVAFAGIPGEPFTEVGRIIKNGSKYALTMPSCLANGCEGYYPTQAAFDEGGYEAETAKYVAGTAEQLAAASVELINSL